MFFFQSVAIMFFFSICRLLWFFFQFVGYYVFFFQSVGYYVYIETSAPARPGFEARLISESLSYATHNCVTFYYHMYGNTIGTLRVWTQLQGTSNPLPVWELHGNQGNSWKKAQVSIPKQGGDYKVCNIITLLCVIFEFFVTNVLTGLSTEKLSNII